MIHTLIFHNGTVPYTSTSVRRTYHGGYGRVYTVCYTHLPILFDIYLVDTHTAVCTHTYLQSRQRQLVLRSTRVCILKNLVLESCRNTLKQPMYRSVDMNINHHACVSVCTRMTLRCRTFDFDTNLTLWFHLILTHRYFSIPGATFVSLALASKYIHEHHTFVRTQLFCVYILCANFHMKTRTQKS